MENKEFVEKHKVTYGCGCVKEIGLETGGGFWKPTGDNQECKEHKPKV